MKRLFETKYGFFDSDGNYVIKTWNTPQPWSNVISNGKYSLLITQSGGGFSWVIHPNLNRITRWFQDVVKDDWGKFIYVKDLNSNKIWSLTFQPVKVNFKKYKVVHAPGFTRFLTQYNNIESELTIFIPPDASFEVWKISLRNLSTRKRELMLFSYFEWCLGDAPDTHREFYKTFIETEYKDNIILARKRVWNIKNKKGESLNRDWEYTAFHFTSSVPLLFETDKINFIGKFGTIEKPAGVVNPSNLKGTTGKWLEPVASLGVKVVLKPGETKSVVFVLGVEKKYSKILKLKEYFSSIENADKEFEKCKKFWNEILNKTTVKTPDESINLLVNKWLKYQAISCRIWGRAAFYQQGGGYGFRDQLQDCQIFFSVKPELARKQIELHASHQFSDGTVFHWWHPIAEEGLRNNISDNLLWLPFITYRYLIETLDFKFLNKKIKYFDRGEDTLYKHCIKTFEVVEKRMSKRYLPLIGGGDWNDGLNAVGTFWKGESIWLAFFFYHILDKWQYIFNYMNDKNSRKKYKQIQQRLKKAIQKYAWDGEWFIRATKDSGEPVGSKKCRYGKIFLNAQTWSIISNCVDRKYQIKAMESVKKYLLKEIGPLLFYPAYKKPDINIGYLSRYAPGVRENGGVYFHAATWALWALLELGERELAYQTYRNLSPVIAGLNPDRFKSEPYVISANIDGPDSPYYGRGSWSWYTGSAAWLFIILLNELLGIKPDWSGIKIDPRIPSHWQSLNIIRYFRNSILNINIRNKGKAEKIYKILVNGKVFKTNIIPVARNKKYNIDVFMI